jgi:hypothetical protein
MTFARRGITQQQQQKTCYLKGEIFNRIINAKTIHKQANYNKDLQQTLQTKTEKISFARPGTNPIKHPK